MRRLLRWTLPFTLAIAAAAVFGSGLWMALRGGAGTPVGTAAEPSQPSIPDPSEALPERSILILGDSLARGTGDVTGRGIGGNLAEMAERDGEQPKVVNVAVNGSRTADLLEKLQRPSIRQLVERSDLIVISIGGNDLFGLSVEPEGTFDPPEGRARREAFDSVLARVAEVIQEIREANPAARVFLLGLYDPFRERGYGAGPYVAAWNAALLERLGSDDRVTVVQTADLFVERDRLSPDRFHPNDEAYRIIARRIAEAAAL